MNQRFTMDRKSFEQFLAAVSVLQHLRYPEARSKSGKLLVHLMGLQQGIDAGSVDFESSMDRVATLALGILKASSAGIFFFRKSGYELGCCARVGKVFDDERAGLEILAQLARMTQSSPEPGGLSGASCPVRACHYPGSPKSTLVAPIRLNGQVAGALAVFSLEFEAFSDRDWENLRFLGSLLERALLKAVQAGYQQAVALEQIALVQVAKRLAPRLDQLEKLAQPSSDDSPWEQATDSMVEEPMADSAVLISTRSAGNVSANAPLFNRTSDTSIPGIGVRAALGGVREFTGEEQPSFIASALRVSAVRTRKWFSSCRSHLGRAKAGVAHSLSGGVRQAGSLLPRAIHSRPVRSAQSATKNVARGAREKIRAVRQYRIPAPSGFHFSLIPWAGLRERVGAATSIFSSGAHFLANVGKNAARHRPSFKIAWMHLRHTLRQAESDYSTLAHGAHIRIRVAFRRQATRITSSTDRAEQVLHQARQSLGGLAGSARNRTRPALVFTVQKQALRRAGGAILVLSIMIGFLVLNTLVRSPFHAESVSADTHVETAAPATHAAANTPHLALLSHLKVTDNSVSENLHELTRYEIATLRRAADYGDDDAAFQLGMAYETGYYLRQNCAKAASWVEKAAGAGNPAAEYNLGLRYRTGDGVPADEAQAEHWLERASKHQYAPARLALLENGRGELENSRPL